MANAKPNATSDRGAQPDDAAPPRFWQLFFIAAIVFLSLAHLPLAIWNSYGSDDAAWDGIAIMLWAQHDRLPTETGIFVEERFRSSPLPAYVLKRLLAAGMVPYRNVPLLMNMATLVAGVLIPGLLYLLWRPLATSSQAAIGVMLLLFSPESFSLKLDGLPTLPALALLLLSLHLFSSGLREQHWPVVKLSLAAGLFVLAVLVKVDVILLSPALLVIAVLAPPQDEARWKCFVLGAALPIAALVVWHLFCQIVAPEAPHTGETFQRWSHRWALSPTGLWDRDNLRAMLMAPGVGTALALSPAAALSLASRGGRWAAAAALACTVPTVLFWGMRELNSSRHNFWLVIPLALFIAAAMERSVRQWQLKALLVAAICVGNYFLGPGPYMETYRQATAKFLTAAAARKERVVKEHADYDLLVARRGAMRRICILQVGAARARAIATFVAHADRCDVRVLGSSHNDWRLTAGFGDDTLNVWIPDAQELHLVWTEVCEREYDLFLPTHGEFPFYHMRGRPQWAGAVEGSRLEPWP
ncbi:MAG TPA: glycosyltransferase family 39 protein [Pirellulaceae bacterium]|nr:glycosyltransferase family 39 protein [Pirellulaceae bacterium]